MAIDLNAALNAAVTNLTSQGLTTIRQPDGSVFIQDANGLRAVITATGPLPAAAPAPINQARALNVNQ